MNFPLRDLYVREICRLGGSQVGGACRLGGSQVGGLQVGGLTFREAYGLGGLQARFDMGLSLEGDRPQSI